MISRFSLEGRVALVAGAGGLLGPVFCDALAEAGADVILTDIVAPEEHAEAIARRHGVRTRSYALDLRDPEASGDIIDAVEQDFGAIGVFLGNAATKGSSLEAFFASDEDFSAETWREVMSVNVDAIFFATRAAGRRMARHGGGSIVLTSSVYGLTAPDQRIYEGSEYLGQQIRSPAVYSASKAALVGLTRHLGALWGAQNVRVNAIAPGGVSSGQNTAFQQSYARRVPMNRMGAADEMAGAVVFLASDAASYITGQVIAVDGGLTCW